MTGGGVVNLVLMSSFIQTLPTNSKGGQVHHDFPKIQLATYDYNPYLQDLKLWAACGAFRKEEARTNGGVEENLEARLKPFVPPSQG